MESGSPGVVELAVELPPFDGAVSGTVLVDDVVVDTGCDEEADPDVVVDVAELGDIDGCAGSAPQPTATTTPSEITNHRRLGT